ncbi:hypothetical protein KUTeg_002976 [Tegillarca granosa]|uniref:AAA+ ATPase domain-containing protein n=1 Tax=Tegillarca granosa TaxID=220873 RepID=A0ABQ9FKS3_TEGGR|nr:hypothetical protein KUTeg_002976 [Tegillarca granosa]
MYKVLKDKVDMDTEETMDNDTKKNNKDSKDEAKIQEEKEKKIKRRSLRLKRKEEDVIIIGSPEPKDEQKTGEDTNSIPDLGLTLPSLLWTEKYQPEHSSEIVGNSALVKKLKSWLLEWKQRVDREARRAKMLLMKQKKKNQEVVQEDEWWADDSCDFDMDSDDSDDEYDRLCNTVMLVGPTGIGKTATVYALAQELGYKVFEVNASSSRNGKRILSQLQEATQSHQVANHKEKTVGTPSKKTNLSTASKSKDITEKKLPTSFANLFKKASTSAKPEKTPTTPSKSKKRKRKEDYFVEEKTPKKKKTGGKLESNTKKLDNKKDLEALGSKRSNLTSISLILFEELDIAFDEDKGFWSAVQHFMNTTKIPIILTTDDPSLSSKFEGRFELYSFKTPSLTNATLYLQLICLVENVRTDSREIFELLTLNKGDIRKTLLSLQYILDSGGGVKQIKHQISLNSKLPPSTHLPLDENTCSQDSQYLVRKVDNVSTVESVLLLNDNKLEDDDDDDDFVSLKPVRSSARRLIVDDESSSSGFQNVAEKKSMEVTSDVVIETPVLSYRD